VGLRGAGLRRRALGHCRCRFRGNGRAAAFGTIHTREGAGGIEESMISW